MAPLDALVAASQPAQPLERPAGAGATKSYLGARLLSLAALSGVLSGLAYAGAAGYHVVRDSFVAPIILSPDSDLVIQSRLSLSRVLAERQALAARIEQNHAAAQAAASAMVRLKDLRADASRALDWARAVTDQQATAGTGTLARLAEQKLELERMAAKQERTVADTIKNVDAGLVRKSDLSREENGLSQLRIALLQNDRDRLAAELQQGTASLAQQALERRRPGGSPATPEMLAHREQLVHIELDLLKLEAELHDKTAQEQADRDELGKADQLIAQMKSRPIFRAIESSQNVAFVPYTQLRGVQAGADVYACDIWGVFLCRRVGRVAQLLPGEVATQDPWGTPARGQYALLALSDGTAAQSKTLRVRESRAAADANPTTEGRSAPLRGDVGAGPVSQR